VVKHEERREKERKTGGESQSKSVGHDGHNTCCAVSLTIRRVLIIPALTDGEAHGGICACNVVRFNIAKSFAKTRGPKFESTPAPSEGRPFTVNSVGRNNRQVH